MTDQFVDHMKANGFTHVSFDMAVGVSIAAWRKNERKAYSVYQAPSLEAAQADILAQIAASAAAKTHDPFADILG